MGKLITCEEDWERLIRKKIIARFGRLKAPLCLRCQKPVQANGFDVDVYAELATFWVECHDEREEMMFRLDHLFEQDILHFKGAFHPLSDAIKRSPTYIRKRVLH